MAIHLRTIEGVRIAVCAVETDHMSDDTYLDDADHYALAAKFSRDWAGRVAGWTYPEEWETMDSQKLRDVKEVFAAWHKGEF